MISRELLMDIMIKGRMDCYVSKTDSYNPYRISDIYDWSYKLEVNELLYTDSYRGVNPYSGVEYVYEKDNHIPIWSCDYVGYVNHNSSITTKEVYHFLKEARGEHLQHCDKDLFMNYTYKKGKLKYESSFEGDVHSILQIENYYYENLLIAQHIAAGRLK